MHSMLSSWGTSYRSGKRSMDGAASLTKTVSILLCMSESNFPRYAQEPSDFTLCFSGVSKYFQESSCKYGDETSQLPRGCELPPSSLWKQRDICSLKSVAFMLGMSTHFLFCSVVYFNTEHLKASYRLHFWL